MKKINQIIQKATAFFIIALLTPFFSFAQDCDCEKNFLWVKQTFEQNDAGFEYGLKQKGKQAYEDHTKKILEKVKSAKTYSECEPILTEWLLFFRKGHIGIQPIQNNTTNPSVTSKKTENFSTWATYPFTTEDFKKYLDKKKSVDYEGIWETGVYKIGIKKDGNGYIGFIIESKAETWTKGQIKFKFSTIENKTNAVFYMRDHSPVESNNVSLLGNNYLEIDNQMLTRTYPKLANDNKYEQYIKLLNTKLPYIESLNKTTLYFRIPSFQQSEKKAIDSVIAANKDRILKTENLIIDIRNGTGGSDNSYQEILPFLYTNPIRSVGAEYLSTKLNNQRMLDFINKPEYFVDEEGKKWAKESYDILDKKLGQFVNLKNEIVSIDTLPEVSAYPKNVGIIINGQNGSTDEEFLLAAKQSKKVKLFGATTFGVLDISNMYFVPSPCNEFKLGYSLTRSFRIPDFTIDGKGLQPDYYLDKSIPKYNWVEFVDSVLNGK